MHLSSLVSMKILSAAPVTCIQSPPLCSELSGSLPDSDYLKANTNARKGVK